MQHKHFPILEDFVARKYPKRAEEISRALDELMEAYREKKIYNVRYLAIKDALSRPIEYTVNELKDTLWYPPRREGVVVPSEIEDFVYNLPFMSTIHEFIAAKKRLDANKSIRHPYLDKLRLLVDEVHPIAIALKELKPHIIKGRMPSNEPPKPVNPNKVMKTCPCCFREIAVNKKGRMVHHGYQRPGYGYQTASCFGQDYLALEVSNEGHDAFMKHLQASIDMLQKRLREAPGIKKLKVKERGTFHNPGKVYEIEPGHEKWQQQYNIYVANIENEIRNLSGTMKYGQRAVEEFRKKHPI